MLRLLGKKLFKTLSPVLRYPARFRNFKPVYTSPRLASQRNLRGWTLAAAAFAAPLTIGDILQQYRNFHNNKVLLDFLFDPLEQYHVELNPKLSQEISSMLAAELGKGTEEDSPISNYHKHMIVQGDFSIKQLTQIGPFGTNSKQPSPSV